MEIYERIKELRKKHLKLSQETFGERLGVSRSVINNIERNVLARPEQKLSLIKLICKEFAVNEEWLLHGTEPMFVETDVFSLDEFVKQHGGTDLELQLMKAYFELAPDIRQKLIENFKDIAVAFTPTLTGKDKTVEELEEEYKKTVLKSALKKDFTALNTTDGMTSKAVNNT